MRIIHWMIRRQQKFHYYSKARNIKKPSRINEMALLITNLVLTTYLAASSSPPSNLARISASAPKSPKVAFSTFA